jgi:hypothetical protein
MPIIIGQGGSDDIGVPYTFVSLLSGATASIDTKISSAVSDILPGFVSNNHQGFVDFMEAYYEWMEQIENPHGTSVTLVDLMDVDKTFDSFIEYFMDIYLKDFPENLAVDSSGNVLSKKTIIKNINDFYSCKGTEKSYKLFLRILYDSDVEFYYPKEDILRVSDGKWVQKKSIKVTSENRTKNFDLVKTKIEQVERSQGGEVTATATVESILQYNIGQYFVTELFLNEIDGNFLQGRKIRGYDSNGDVLYEDIYSIPSVVEIVAMGAGYRSGDGAIIDKDSLEYLTGEGSEIEVSGVDRDGGVEEVLIKNHGVNYTSTTSDDRIPLIFRSTSGDGNATGNILLSALCVYPGYWNDNDGKLSSNKFMRDNMRFHEFSYVLKTETAIENYREQARKLIHPAGTRLFGDVSLLNTISSSIPYHTEIIKMEPPLIGHYTPYTLNTQDNLRGATGSGSSKDLYYQGFQPGATAIDHCLGATGGRIEIIGTGDGGFTLGSFRTSESMSGSTSGFTADIFGWHRRSITGGVLFLKSNDGESLGFTLGETIIGTGGITGTVVGIRIGNGTVLESGTTQHATGPAGSLGSGGTAGAGVHGLTYWGINPSFQSTSGEIVETLTVKSFTDTSPYTAGYDYTIGSIVQQTHPTSLGVSAEGIVQDWIPGISGGTGNVLKIRTTSSTVFGGGTIYEINNNDNYRYGIPIEYGFTSAGISTDTEFRNKIKNITLDEVLLMPTSGEEEYIFHSGDDEEDVVGGYTGTMAGE